ncbi:uncharacterized protein N7483_002376 [Penicillium malachiteum]|uniref:uncharacterized protein n=1 Tax=Penicillium malachiteum TaxID=1324776 RepID=UPI0025498E8F|nr:uncharacterized protein N7483_002376 [Penicillium malachiteum]KAJ5737251.1 hypothetical protein N7483_002376 [Penicillium malachiteum]
MSQVRVSWTSRMAIHLHFLLFPAESALESLLHLRMDSTDVYPEDLSQDASLVLQACKFLRGSRVDKGSIEEDVILPATANSLVLDLSRSTIEKLSVITWHFDSSGAVSEGLSCFLRRPIDNAVWEAVHRSYQVMTKQTVPFKEFKGSHDFLLYPILY